MSTNIIGHCLFKFGRIKIFGHYRVYPAAETEHYTKLWKSEPVASFLPLFY